MAEHGKLSNMIAATTHELQLAQFVEQCKSRIDDIFHSVLPEKAIEFDKLAMNPLFGLDRLDEVRQSLNIPYPPAASTLVYENAASSKKRKIDNSDAANGQTGMSADAEGVQPSASGFTAKVFALPNGVAPKNEKIEDLIKIVKPKLVEMAFLMNRLKLGIVYRIPKVEDGNNFGVDVQETVLNEIKSSEADAIQHIDQFGGYYQARARLISKVVKYPHIEDYRAAVTDLDEKQFLLLRLTVNDCRDTYAVVYDVLKKNYEKVKNPRSDRHHQMF